jgi:hypothetical protein
VWKEWRWTRVRIATILKIDSKYVPPYWLLRPDFDVWPPQSHRAIIWMLAHLVIYRIQAGRALSFDDYMDFLRRSKWKTDSWSSGRRMVGNYLSILEFPAEDGMCGALAVE